ncbi:hypothetical protein Tsp_07141 [Trichinella spiralis]|uniref:hypothetical protein n=1 Tax=Trichinella spiralis TaxID=6334 RepID=UPI0001EFBB83|nr:hypothetical protein Tsp_07141 [Trichinella spiralis]
MQRQQFQFIHDDAKADVEKQQGKTKVKVSIAEFKINRIEIFNFYCCCLAFAILQLRRPAVALPGVTLFPPSGRAFLSAAFLTRVASQNLAVRRQFPSSWGLHFSRPSSKEHPSVRSFPIRAKFGLQLYSVSMFELRLLGASSYQISSVLVPCRFSDVPLRADSPYFG